MAEGPAEDLDATEINFTGKPVPGYQEVEGDLFSSRAQSKKGHVYALAHCISSDATTGAGIAVDVCNHFADLRRRVKSEASVQPALIPIFYGEDSCWVYNLVTKRFHFHRPNRDDFRECLVLMREHALLNKVEGIHMPCIGAGLDGLDWDLSRSTILEIFRDQPICFTAYVPAHHCRSSKWVRPAHPIAKPTQDPSSPLGSPTEDSESSCQTEPAHMSPPRTQPSGEFCESLLRDDPEEPTREPPNAHDYPTPNGDLGENVSEGANSSCLAHPPGRRSVQARTENSSGEDTQSRKGLNPSTENCSGENASLEKGVDPAIQNSSGEKPDDHLVNSVTV